LVGARDSGSRHFAYARYGWPEGSDEKGFEGSGVAMGVWAVLQMLSPIPGRLHDELNGDKIHQLEN